MPARSLLVTLTALLRHHRDFRRLFLAQMLVSGVFWLIQIPLLVLLNQLTGNGMWGALTLAVQTGVTAALLPFAGAVADRVDRRKIIMTANAVQIVSLLPMFAIRSDRTAWLAILAVGVFASADAFYVPAAMAAVPNLVPAEDLAGANAAVASAYGITFVLAASVGGVLVEAFDPYVCLVLTVAVLAIAILLVRLVRQPMQADAAANTTRSRTAVREGITYLIRNPRALAFVTVKSAVGISNGALAVYPLLAISLGAAGIGTGLLFAIRGVGILLGPLVLGRLFLTSPYRLIPGLATSMVAFGLCIVAAATMPNLLLVLLFILLAYIAAGSNWALSSYALQAEVPDALRGRVVAVDIMLSGLAISLSQLMIGAFIGTVNIRVLMAACGATTALYASAWLLATGRLRKQARSSGLRRHLLATGQVPAGSLPPSSDHRSNG